MTKASLTINLKTYAQQTGHLTLEQEGAFWRILRAMAEAGGRLACDAVQKATGADDIAWARIAPAVVPLLRSDGTTATHAMFAAAKVTDAQVCALWQSVPTLARQRSSKPDVRRALDAALSRGRTFDEIMAGLQAAYRSPVYGGEHAKGVHRLIENDRWEGFTETTAQPAQAPAARFNGPSALRESVVKIAGEQFARAYIDPASYRAEDRTLIAATRWAATEMRQTLGQWAQRVRVTIAEPQSAAA